MKRTFLTSVLFAFPGAKKSGPTSGSGDEAFVHTMDSSDVVLRKDRYVIYVQSGVDVEMDPDTRTLFPADLELRRKSEQQRIGRWFARLW